MSWSALSDAQDSVARSIDLMAQEIATAPGEQAAELQGRCDALSTLAGALSSVAWGPQGGHSTGHNSHTQTYDYKAGVKRPAGFNG